MDWARRFFPFGRVRRMVYRRVLGSQALIMVRRRMLMAGQLHVSRPVYLTSIICTVVDRP